MFGSPHRRLYIYSITTRGKNRLPYTHIQYLQGIKSFVLRVHVTYIYYIYNNITAGVHQGWGGGSIVRLFRAFSFVCV